MAWTKAKTAIVISITVILAAGMAAMLIIHLNHQAGPPTDMAVLQGTWTGQETAGSPGFSTLKIEGKNLEFHGANPNMWYKATFSLREGTVPKQLVAIVTDCIAAQYINKTSYAIYEIKDGTFTMVASNPGKTKAPSSFDAPNGQKFIFTKK